LRRIASDNLSWDECIDCLLQVQNYKKIRLLSPKFGLSNEEHQAVAVLQTVGRRRRRLHADKSRLFENANESRFRAFIPRPFYKQPLAWNYARRQTKEIVRFDVVQ
jgi:hypothetical protein